MQMMTAAVLENFDEELKLVTKPIPKPSRGEVLVKVLASGLCASDLHIRDGKIATVKLPYTPGHEISGEIVAVGDGVSGCCVGDYIVAAIDITCKRCEYCLSGRSNLCTELVRIGFERDGGHAQYCVIPAENAFLVDRSIPPEVVTGFVDAFGCMYNAVKNRAKVTADDKVLIMGVGGLGINGLQLAKHYGAEVYCSSREQEKLDIAESFGCDLAVNTQNTDLYTAVMNKTNGRGCDVVIDNVGIKSSINLAVKLVRPGGKVIVCGYIAESFEVNYQEILKFEKEILGVRGMTRKDLADVIKLVEAGKVTPYVYKTIPLSQINEGLQELESGAASGRIVIVNK